jgi:urease accessory protein
MPRATTIVRKPAVKADRVADTITLDHEARRRREGPLTADGGLEFLLDLDTAAGLNDGDAVKLEDGRLVTVKAAPQRLMEIRAENPLRLMRAAVRIGNRHASAEVTADALYIEDDPALSEMVRGLGCTVTPVMRAFRPEPEDAAHDCGHDHHSHGHHHGHAHDDHGHDHAHGHGHAHGEHEHGEAHGHGAGCGCGHHGHKHEH